MQAPLGLFNPAAFWLSATMQATNSFFALAAARTPEEREHAMSSESSAAASAFPSPYVARRTGSETHRERSWYRVPYRSPFDPMFWMTPGHPVDHLQDWLKLMPYASAFLAGVPVRQFDVLMPQFGAVRDAVSSAYERSPRQPIPGFPTWLPATAAPPMAAQLLPGPEFWLAPWKSMMDAFTAPQYVPQSGRRADANVIDFEKAYSTYRSAGGHAVAQIVRPGQSAPADQRLQEPPPTVFDMFRWFLK